MKSAPYTNEQIGKAEAAGEAAGEAAAIKPFSQMSVKFFMALFG